MASLLDFTSTPTDPQTGDPNAQAPASAITYSDPAIQGAVTGVVNGLAQSVQGFFEQLPSEVGLAVPQTAPGLFTPAGGGVSLGTIMLIGAAVYFLMRKK